MASVIASRKEPGPLSFKFVTIRLPPIGGVLVGTIVLVNVAVGKGVMVGLGKGVAVGTGLGVKVLVGRGVLLAVAVAVGSGVLLAVGVLVGSGVLLGSGVAVGSGVSLAVGVFVGVLLGVGVLVVLGWLVVNVQLRMSAFSVSPPVPAVKPTQACPLSSANKVPRSALT